MLGVKVRALPWDFASQQAAADTDMVNCRFYGGLLLEVPEEALHRLSVLTEYVSIGLPFTKGGTRYVLAALPYSEQNCESSGAMRFNWAEACWQQMQYLGDPIFSDQIKEVLKGWIGFFDYLTYKAHSPDGGLKFEHELFRYDDLLDVIRHLAVERDEIYKPLIVTISQEFIKFLPVVLNGIRKTLRRENQLQKLDKVNEINANSLRWLVKQPGKSIAQKAAANDNKILAVVRAVNYDQLENRVLKDFLRRCCAACRNFLQDSRRSSYEDAVTHFEHLCADGLQRAEFEQVRLPAAAIVPNYVLQNDLRYRKVWQYYKDLLRQNRRVDDLLHWLYITAGEVSCLMTAAALYALPERNAANPHFTLQLIASSNLKIFKEHRQGELIDHALPPGSFYLCGNSGREYILDFISDTARLEADPRNKQDLYAAAAQTAAVLGTKSCILCTPLHSEDAPYLILLYSLNTALCRNADAAADSAAICQSAEHFLSSYPQLNGGSLRLLGAVFNYELAGAEVPAPQGTLHTQVCRVPMQVRQWGHAIDRVKDAVSALLTQVVQNG